MLISSDTPTFHGKVGDSRGQAEVMHTLSTIHRAEGEDLSESQPI